MCDCAASEVWKVIPDWTDYEVSDHGNVRSTKLGNRYELKPQVNRQRNNGHDYTPENTYYSNGSRFCKACSRARYAANAEENARKARERRAAKRLGNLK